jgi:hypothetical protein
MGVAPSSPGFSLRRGPGSLRPCCQGGALLVRRDRVRACRGHPRLVLMSSGPLPLLTDIHTLFGWHRAPLRGRPSPLRVGTGVPWLADICVWPWGSTSRSELGLERVGCGLGRVGCTGILGVQGLEIRLHPVVDVGQALRQLGLATMAGLAVDSRKLAPSTARPHRSSGWPRRGNGRHTCVRAWGGSWRTSASGLPSGVRCRPTHMPAIWRGGSGSRCRRKRRLGKEP